MNNQANERRHPFPVLSVLVAGLLLAVIVQSVILYGMQRKLNRFEERPVRKPVVTASQTTETNIVASADPFGQGGRLRPFGGSLDDADWDPFQEMHAMHERINELFGSAFGRFQQSDVFSGLSGKYVFSPNINLVDQGDSFLVTVDLPGAEDSRIDVHIQGQTLTISGTLQAETSQTDKGKILRQERQSGSFKRILTLPVPVQADKMTTTNKKGVLSIIIPKETK